MRMKAGEKWRCKGNYNYKLFGRSYLFLSVEVSLTTYVSRPVYTINGLDLSNGEITHFTIKGNAPNKPGEITCWEKIE